MLDNLTMSGGLVDRLFVAALVASGVVACGGNSGGSPGAPSPLEPETASCQGAGRAFDGPIAIHDDTHGGPREPVRIDTASGTLCVVVEELTGRDIRLTGWLLVDGETHSLPALLETLDVNGFASHDVALGHASRPAWLFQGVPSCGAAQMTRLVLGFGEATVQASVGLVIKEYGTSSACEGYAIDAALYLAE